MSRNLFTVLCLLASVAVQGASLSDIAHDADSSVFYGDFFHAYRDYSYIESESEPAFLKTGLDGYLKSLFVLGTREGIQSECGKWSGSKDPNVAAKAAYICGHHFVEVKNTVAAEMFLKKIKLKSHFYWPAQICLATAYILSNDPQAAIDTLKPAPMRGFEEFNLEDEFHLTLARAYTAENKFDEALKNYQAIGGKSPFYIQTLEESAWIFFKMRRFESSQVLLDALIGHYESAQRIGDLDVPIFTYYRARYLKAYQALTEKRTEGAAAEFVALRNEYDRTIQKMKPMMDSQKVLEAIKSKNLKWTDTAAFPKDLKQQLDFISQWMGADTANGLQNDIYYQMALSRELARADKYGEVFQSETPGLVDKLKQLQAQTWTDFADHYDRVVKRVTRDMETIKVKAELGRLEIVWLKRAEGARSLDEVIDNYRQEAGSLDEYLEK